jgi:hypothetical protein
MIDHRDGGLHEFLFVPIQGAKAAGTEHLMREVVQPEIRGWYTLAVVICGPNLYQWYVVPTQLSLTKTK